MTIKKLKENITTLKEAQGYLNKCLFINSGGCGVSALSLYRWLKKNKKLDNTMFVYLYRDDSEDYYLNNKQVLRNKQGVPTSCSHCCLLHNGKFIDSTGEIDITKYKWVQIITEESFVKESVNNVNAWNCLFNRDYINLIEKALKIDLGDIKDGY